MPFKRSETGELEYYDLAEIRKRYKLPPSPPPDRRYYSNGVRVKTVEELRVILRSKTLSGDLLRLEIAWRVFKLATYKYLKPVLKPILDYLK